MTRKLIRNVEAPRAIAGSHRPTPVKGVIDNAKALPPDIVNYLDEEPPRPRLHFLSNLRIFLTVLVIFHHTAVPYGGIGSWYFQSRCFPSTSPLLAVFNAMNQTFFMALFMWMAGFFTYRELSKFEMTERRIANVSTWERFGVRAGFLVDRGKRLLLPALFYTLVIEPAIILMVKLHNNTPGSSSPRPASQLNHILAILTTYYTTLPGIRGPVWFPTLVFIFDALATTLPLLLQFLTSRPPTLTPYLQLHHWSQFQHVRLTFFALSILTAFLIRTIYPIGTTIPLLNLQPAFLPQYIFAYAAGHISAATGNFYCYSRIPDIKTRPWRRLLLSTLKMLVFLTVIISFTAVGARCSSKRRSFRRGGWKERTVRDLAGGWNKAALAYAVFNELGFVEIVACLVAVFERFAKRLWTVYVPGVGRRAVTRYCYAAFLVHGFVSVGVELVVEKMVLGGGPVVMKVGPVVMVVVVGCINVVLSWVVAVVVCEATWFGRWV